MNYTENNSFIQAWRNKTGITQAELSAKMGVKKSKIDKWEKGICIPNEAELGKLAKAFEINTFELLNYPYTDNCHNSNSIAFEKLMSFYQMQMRRQKQNILYALITLFMVVGTLSILLIDRASILLFCGMYLPVVAFIVLLTTIIFVVATHRKDKIFIIIGSTALIIILLTLALLILAPLFGAPVPN